jgi:hypothetical protein
LAAPDVFRRRVRDGDCEEFMHFTDQDLRAAVSAGALDAERLNPLLDFLAGRAATSTVAPAPRFDLAHLLWYAGALIVIAAMGLFSTLAFSAMGGWALTATALCYAAAFAAAGHYLWHHKNLRVPGGLLITVAVSMAPLAVYGIQDAMGMWGQFGRPGTVRDFYVWIKGSWVYMEITTIVAALLALWRYRFPFIVMILAVALWFLSMDLTPWIFGRAEFTWDERRLVSLWFGLGVLAIAYLVDRRPRGGDFAFWLHLFGLMAFWGALSLSNSGSELGAFLYALINVGLLLMSVLLGRRVYAVFGTLGIAGYLGHLSYRVFRDSMMFPFALSLIGIAVIAAWLLYHRNQAAIAAWIEKSIPESLRNLRPAHAR